MMFGFGWLMMLVVIGLPILLVVILLVVAAGFFQNRPLSMPYNQNRPQVYQPSKDIKDSITTAARFCSHCGAGIQPDWSHCPQCGAPV